MGLWALLSDRNRQQGTHNGNLHGDGRRRSQYRLFRIFNLCKSGYAAWHRTAVSSGRSGRRPGKRHLRVIQRNGL